MTQQLNKDFGGGCPTFCYLFFFFWRSTHPLLVLSLPFFFLHKKKEIKSQKNYCSKVFLPIPTVFEVIRTLFFLSEKPFPERPQLFSLRPRENFPKTHVCFVYRDRIFSFFSLISTQYDYLIFDFDLAKETEKKGEDEPLSLPLFERDSSPLFQRVSTKGRFSPIPQLPIHFTFKRA